MDNKDNSIVDLAKYMAGESEPGVWRSYPFPLPYEIMTDLQRQGHLRLGINDALAYKIIDENQWPRSEKAALHLWSWVAMGVFVASIVLSFVWQWWAFIPGFILKRVIWSANKKSASGFVLAKALEDQTLYDAVVAVDGWIISTDLSYDEINKMFEGWLNQEPSVEQGLSSQ